MSVKVQQSFVKAGKRVHPAISVSQWVMKSG